MPETNSPLTRTSLLMRLRDPRDEQAWRDFVDLYAPWIHQQARRSGLQDADAADVTQDVLRKVAATMAKFEYDRRQGEFRGWLYRVTQNQIRDWCRLQLRQVNGSGDSSMRAAIEEFPANDDRGQVALDREWRQRLLEWALERVKAACEPHTWQAFWMTAVEGRRGEEVAQSLGMSLGAVYVAKGRVIVRLKNLIEEHEEET